MLELTDSRYPPRAALDVHVVRINSVRFGFLSLLILAVSYGQTDHRLSEALPHVAQEAAHFWHAASGYIGRETLKQKAIVPSRRRLRLGQTAVEPRPPSFKDREIVSYYGFSAYNAAPEALHEFRYVLAVDGKPEDDANAARAKLKRAGLK